MISISLAVTPPPPTPHPGRPIAKTKAGDMVEFARKGLKYLTATDPKLEKAIVGGDATTVKSISWSALGTSTVLPRRGAG